MGLDISAYAQLRLIGPPTAEWDYADGTICLYVNEDFPGRADEIESRSIYAFSEELGFGAGSYGGYNAWREQLATLAGYPARLNREYCSYPTHSAGAWDATAGPFWELISFADNEGTIGAAVSAKLARDFATFQPKVDELPANYFESTFVTERFRLLYSDFRRAFELASNNGAVRFH